jgi:hypothetical protein
MSALILIVAQLTAAQVDAAKATYKNLPPAEVEAKKIDAPPADAKRVDVSAKIRSASFGHKTWLLIAPDGTRYWVEYGRSTNAPGALFGPFPLEAGGDKAGGDKPAGDKPAGAPGTTSPDKPKVLKQLPGPPPTEGPKPAPAQPKM